MIASTIVLLLLKKEHGEILKWLSLMIMKSKMSISISMSMWMSVWGLVAVWVLLYYY